MKKIFFLWICLTATRGMCATLFYDPYNNDLLKFDGEKIQSALMPFQSLNRLSIDAIIDGASKYNQPVVWDFDKVLFVTEQGTVAEMNARTQMVRTIYPKNPLEQANRCQQGKAPGCIYSIISHSRGVAIFTETDGQGFENLVRLESEVTSELVRSQILVKGIPAPKGSGPIFVRHNGNLGILPFESELLEIPREFVFSAAPPVPVSFEEIKPKTEAFWFQPALHIFEGLRRQGGFETGVFSAFVNSPSRLSFFLNLNPTRNHFAKSVAFDGCSGSTWIMSSDEKFLELSNGVDSVVTQNPEFLCPLASAWEIASSDLGLGASDVSLSYRLQGTPSGSGKFSGGLNVFSLGKGGTITLRPKTVIKPGAFAKKLKVFENAFFRQGPIDDPSGLYAEPASVELFDGSKWKSTGCDCANPDPKVCAGMQPTLATLGYGTPFDSNDAGGLSLDIKDEIHAIRITDCQTPDGNASSGFDLDAIVVTR